MGRDVLAICDAAEHPFEEELRSDARGEDRLAATYWKPAMAWGI